MLKFRVNGQNLRRVDSSKVVADSRNYLQAEFKVSSDWSGYEPICATFNRDDKGKCVSVEVVDEVCAVPWEVLEGAGVLEVTLQGGDLITTNVVEIELIDSGELDGLKPTEATPGLYGSLKNRVAELEESVSGLGSEVDTELVKAVNAIVDDTLEATSVKADSVSAAKLVASGTCEIEDIKNKYTTTLTKDKVSTNADVETRLKFSKSGYDLKSTTTYADGTEAVNEIKTSNSKLTVKAADFGIESEKSIKMEAANNITGDFGNEFKITYNDDKRIAANQNSTSIFGDSTEIVVDSYNVNIKADGGDVNINAQNVRNDVTGGYYIDVTKDNGTGSCSANVINETEGRTVKSYLGSDVARFGIAENTSGSKNSGIDAGLTVIADNGYKVKLQAGGINDSDDEADMTIRADKIDMQNVNGNDEAIVYANEGISIFGGGAGSNFKIDEFEFIKICTPPNDGDEPNDAVNISGTYVNISGNTAFDGYATFEKNTEFKGYATFEKNTEFKGYATFDNSVTFSSSVASRYIARPYLYVGKNRYYFLTEQQLDDIYDGAVKKQMAVLCGGIIAEGAAGENATAYLCQDGSCFVTGSGDMVNDGYMASINSEFKAAAEKAVVSDGITSICASAFSGYNKLTNVIIPSSVTSIGNYAFYYCTSLTSITIPASVTSIGEKAFGGCTNLITITINKAEDSIEGAPWGATNATVTWTGTDDTTEI